MKSDGGAGRIDILRAAELADDDDEDGGVVAPLDKDSFDLPGRLTRSFTLKLVSVYYDAYYSTFVA